MSSDIRVLQEFCTDDEVMCVVLQGYIRQQFRPNFRIS